MTTIAIDGPSGSGKSTLARLLADRLGLDYLDTGAMYRAVALLAIWDATPLTDADALAKLAGAMDLEVADRVTLNGRDVTAEIRTPAVTAAVSPVAATQVVRDELVRRQREWVELRRGGVVEGRDIGSVVLPDADVKVYLTAEASERARRRAEEPESLGGGGNPEDHRSSMARRDAIDSGRVNSPLVVAPDALIVDSTTMTPAEIADLVEEALAASRGRAAATAQPSTDRDEPAERPEGAIAAPPGRGALAFYAICRAFVVGVSRCYFRGTVVGAERVPRSGPYILAPIHRSYVDWLVVARLTRRRLRYVVKAEVWRVAAVGRLIELLGAFPVHRGSADRESLGRCLQALASGEPLVIFPEGTRQEGLEVRELLEGAAYLSLRAGVPIIPVGLAGTVESMPKGAKFPKPRRVVIVVGAPIGVLEPPPARRVSRRATSERTVALREAIQAATDEARSLL